MIDDLDRTIEQLLAYELPAELAAQVAISFAAPDDEFPPATVQLPALDVFLYDIRENRELRSTEWPLERSVDGVVRRSPLVRLDCSYLITAWASQNSTTRAQDEHRMLGEAIAALVRHPTIPEPLLQGALAGQQPPLPTSTLQPGRLQSLGEFWQALGGKPKAAVSYTVTIGMEPVEPGALGPPVVDRQVALRQGTEAG
jgi:hypothetical protein